MLFRSPAFTSAISGFVGNDSSIITGPKYTVDPAFNGEAGIYSIIPSDLVMKYPANYEVAYIPGILYVNPEKITSKNIKISLDCIERTNNDTAAFSWVGHFTYKNANATAVFIPLGTDNNIKSGGAYTGVQPELFMPGTGHFDLFSDGPGLVWTLKSYNCNIKVTDRVLACSTSTRCADRKSGV